MAKSAIKFTRMEACHRDDDPSCEIIEPVTADAPGREYCIRGRLVRGLPVGEITGNRRQGYNWFNDYMPIESYTVEIWADDANADDDDVREFEVTGYAGARQALTAARNWARDQLTARH